MDMDGTRHIIFDKKGESVLFADVQKVILDACTKLHNAKGLHDYWKVEASLLKSIEDASK